MDTTLDAVVVGAGLSGLAAAHHLVQQGLRVQVLEAAPRAGGVIASHRREGCLYETGPHSAMAGTPAVDGLVAALGLQPRLRWASDTSARHRYLVRDGRVLAAPAGPLGFLATPLFSARAKLGLLREVFAPRAHPADDESVADFVRRRLGPEFLDHAVDALVGGIYAADPERLSMAATFPALQALEQRHGGLLRGAFARARERRRRGAPRRGLPRSFSFDGGMQVLTDALAAAVPLALQTPVQRFEAAPGGGFVVEAPGPTGPRRLVARALLLATPADATAALLRTHDAGAAAALAAIEHAPLACVSSVYARADVAHPLDGFGCLVPAVERRRVLGVLFPGTLFDGRAAPGQVLLASFVGGRRQPALAALPEDRLLPLVHEENVALLGARRAPRWQALTRWPRALPQYERGHLGRVATAARVEAALPGLVLCGSWRGGPSVGDCIAGGQAAGERIAGMLRADSNPARA